MSLLLVGMVTVVSPLVGVGIFKLQARLERWDCERHAED